MERENDKLIWEKEWRNGQADTDTDREMAV